MRIKLGYGDKPLHITIRPGEHDRQAEVWIVQTLEGGDSETLAYATLDELLDLQDELKTTIKELVK